MHSMYHVLYFLHLNGSRVVSRTPPVAPEVAVWTWRHFGTVRHGKILLWLPRRPHFAILAYINDEIDDQSVQVTSVAIIKSKSLLPCEVPAYLLFGSGTGSNIESSP